MDFYDKVTEENALDWYAKLPAHLKKKIDDKRAKFKPGMECLRRELPALYETVERELGKRPLKPADPVDPLDGWTHAQMAQYDALKAWAARYDQLLMLSLIVESAPDIQNERRMLNEVMGLNVTDKSLPPQADGLDATTAATVRWMQMTGETPIEVLTRTMRDDEAKMGDRLSAARILMDFVHRRVPTKVEQKIEDVTAPKIDQKLLKGLSAKELTLLETLLKKMNADE